MTTELRAFHGDRRLKDKYLKRVKRHRLADQLIKGIYWEDGRGCAVGCTVHNRDPHPLYESVLGIPKWLAYLEDQIFENLNGKEAQEWPEKFMKAIHTGANLREAEAPMLLWSLALCKAELGKTLYNALVTAVEITQTDLYEEYPDDHDARRVYEGVRDWRRGIRYPLDVDDVVAYAVGFRRRNAGLSIVAEPLLKILRTIRPTKEK